MAEVVTLDKVLDGANVWLQDQPANVRVEVLWHRASADGSVRTVEGPRTLWEASPDGTAGPLASPFDVSLLPANPTLADLFRVVRDSYVLPLI